MWRRIVLLVVFLGLVTVSSQAEERVFSVTVSGEAVVLAVPDEAIVMLSIQSNRHNNRAVARGELDLLATELMTYLDRSGVPERKIKMLQRQVTPQYKHHDGERRLTGYVGQQRFQVIVPLEEADELLEGLPNSVDENGTSFRVSNARQLRDEAVDLAIDDAVNRARRRAEKLGINLGPVIGFQDSALGQARAQPEMGMRMMAAATDASVQLPAGENALRVNVSVTFRIEVPE